MHNMVDYGYYTGAYMGARIPEAAFPEFIARAEDALLRLQRQYTVTGTEEGEKMALCAMAEAIYDGTGRRGGVASASVGQVSVRYRDRDSAVYDSAAIYLDIYRGVAT